MVVTRLILEEQDSAISVLLHRAGQREPERCGPAIPFANPLTADELEELRFYLEDYLELPVGVYADAGAWVENVGLKAWGERLFAATFGADPECRVAYDHAATEAARGTPLEVLISSTNPRFLGLPWELLKNPEEREPIALRAAGFDRTIPQHDPAVRLNVDDELRVLMVIARPEGIADVPYQSIARPLFRQLERVRGKVSVDLLRPPTFAALKARLVQDHGSTRPYHLVHFDGHGTSEAGMGGHLAFEKAAGEGAEWISAEAFAAVLRAAGIPLVVLNACRSAAISAQSDATGPEANVATCLLQEGTAAVVAMSYSIYVVAAAAFAATLYEQLFQGRSLSQAVAAGRLALRQQSQRPGLKGSMPLQDWMVPVHYARAEVALTHLTPVVKSAPSTGTFFADLLAEARERASASSIAEAAPEGNLIAAEGGAFFGRDADFFALERAVRLSHVCVIHGIAGTGKSELAKAFARWLRDTGGVDGEEYIFFHSCEPGVAGFDLDAVLTRIGSRLLGADFARPTDGAASQTDLVLKQLSRRRMVLIWDNFESVVSLPEQGQATPPLDEAGRSHLKRFVHAINTTKSVLLITSRSPEPWLDEVYRLQVGSLDRHGAMVYADFLLAADPRAEARRRDDAFKDLMDQLEGHPLSMRLILPHLRHSDTKTLIAGLQGEAELPQDSILVGGRATSLASSIDYSFRHLAPQDQRPLSLLALIAGEAAFEALGFLHKTEGIPPRYAELDNHGWRRLLERCARLGLVSLTRPGIFHLHPVLPAFLLALWRAEAKAAFEIERETTQQALIAAHAGLGHVLQNQVREQAREGWSELAISVIAALERPFSAMLAAALEHRLFFLAHVLLGTLTEVWERRGLWLELRSWVDRVRKLTEGTAGSAPLFGSEAGVLWLYAVGNEVNRALAAGDLDLAHQDLRAIRPMLEAADSADARLHLGSCYRQLGTLAKLRGRLAAAERWYRKSHAIKKEVGDLAGMASIYDELGAVAQQRGQLDVASDWQRRALAIDEAGDRPGMARSFLKFGTLARERGKWDAAVHWCRKALGIFRELGNKRGIGEVYFELGIVAFHRGRPKSAETCYRKALALAEGVDDRPGIARAYHELGMVAHQRRQLDAAESWHLRALGIAEELGWRPAVAGAYHHLGILKHQRNQWDDAERWYRKSLVVEEELNNLPGVAKTSLQLGLLARARGDEAAALAWVVRSNVILAKFPASATASFALEALKSCVANLGLGRVTEAWQAESGMLMPKTYLDQLRQTATYPDDPA